MTSVHFANDTNSTTFTNCCGCAISEEKNCPKCGEEIDGYTEDGSNKTRNNRFNIAFAPYRTVNKPNLTGDKR